MTEVYIFSTVSESICVFLFYNSKNMFFFQALHFVQLDLQSFKRDRISTTAWLSNSGRHIQVHNIWKLPY
jgi:hypothetical protein